jgi:hypothetical protein
VYTVYIYVYTLSIYIRFLIALVPLYTHTHARDLRVYGIDRTCWPAEEDTCVVLASGGGYMCCTCWPAEEDTCVVLAGQQVQMV